MQVQITAAKMEAMQDFFFSMVSYKLVVIIFFGTWQSRLLISSQQGSLAANFLLLSSFFSLFFGVCFWFLFICFTFRNCPWLSEIKILPYGCYFNSAHLYWLTVLMTKPTRINRKRIQNSIWKMMALFHRFPVRLRIQFVDSKSNSNPLPLR